MPCAPSKSTRSPASSARSTRSDVVGDEGAEPLRVVEVRLDDLLDVERLELVDALQPDVLLGDGELELLAEDLGVEQILHPDADSRRLVRVRRADPATGRPDLEPAEPPLTCAVERDVPRHHEVRVPGDEEQALRPVAAALELVELLREDAGIDDAPGPIALRFPATIPLGICRILYVSPSTTIVWPAFGPPW